MRRHVSARSFTIRPSTLLARRPVYDGSELELSYMIDTLRKEGDTIPVMFPKDRMVGRIDRLLQLPSTKVHPQRSSSDDENAIPLSSVPLPSPLRGRSVFRPDLSEEEFDSLGPEERLRVALMSGQPILQASQSPADQERYERQRRLYETGVISEIPQIRRIRKHYSDYRLLASKIEIRSERGTRHYAVVLWQAPTPSMTSTKIKMPGWQTVEIKSKTRHAAMEAGELRHVIAKFHKLLGDELRRVPRFYPVLVTRPINPLTERFSDIGQTLQEEQMMLRLVQQIQPLPPLQLEERVYYTDLELQRQEREIEIQTEERRPRAAEPSVRGNLKQDAPDWDSADLILTQGAVALLVSDSIEELDGLPKQTADAVLGKNRMPEKIVVRNLPSSPIGGATLRTGTHTTIVRMTLDELHPALDMSLTPSFVPSPEYVYDESDPDALPDLVWPVDEKLVAQSDSDLPPPLALRVQGEQVIVVLRPGQNVAEMPPFWDRGYERNTTRVLRLPDGCHVLPFGTEQVCWPVSKRIHPRQLLDLLRGR